MFVRRVVPIVAALGVMSGCGATPSDAARTARTQHAALACSSATLPRTAGKAVDVTLSAGSTTARLSGRSGAAYDGTPRLRSAKLTLTRGSSTWSTTVKPVVRTSGNGVLVSGVESRSSSSPLCLATFSPGNAPVALVGVTSALNQCCSYVRTYSPGVRPTSRLQSGTVGVGAVSVAGTALLRTGDGTFLARFTDYADSVAPLRLLSLRAGRQVDVTAAHPALLRADARRWWRLSTKKTDRLGLLAAWTADEVRLGRTTAAFHTLDRLAGDGKLTGPKGGGDLWKTGAAYVSALRTYLKAARYL
jgi:hypothetical protein